MSITLTERAATHVQNYLTKRGKGIGLRFGVRTTGCSGMAYKIEFVVRNRRLDRVFGKNRAMDLYRWQRQLFGNLRILDLTSFVNRLAFYPLGNE